MTARQRAIKIIKKFDEAGGFILYDGTICMARDSLTPYRGKLSDATLIAFACDCLKAFKERKETRDLKKGRG